MDTTSDFGNVVGRETSELPELRTMELGTLGQEWMQLLRDVDQGRRTFADVFAEAELRQPPTCWCITCDDAWRQSEYARTEDMRVLLSRMFIVCPECGNKRCPRATWHENTCTGSNEPGQAGSSYAAIPAAFDA